MVILRGPMQKLLSTVELDLAKQFLGFKNAVCSQIAQLSVDQIGSGAFSARIDKARAGNFDFTNVQCDPVLIERSAKSIHQDGENCYFVTLQRKGLGHIRQMGREVELRPGEFAVVDSAIPYVITFNEPVDRLVARFPKREFEQRGCSSERFCGQVFQGTTGAGQIASRLLNMLSGSGGNLDAGLGLSLSAAAIDAIVLSEETGVSAAGTSQRYSQTELLRRVRIIVLANLTDPDLSTEFIAGEAGISVRYLHKVFAGTGTSLNKWIQQERLARCHRELSNPRNLHRSIQDIAFSNGFNDSGYFSNRFMRAYGIKPSDVRKAAKAALD